MSDTFLSLLLGAALRSTIILVAALLAARLFVRRSAAVRHAVFTAGVAGVIVVPVIMVALPAVRAPFIAEAVSESLEWLEGPVRSLRRETVARPVELVGPSVVDEISLRSPGGTSSTSRGALILTMVWAAGVLAIGGRTVVRAVRAFRLARRARPIGGMQGILETTELDAPATVGILRSAVLLPATRSWSDEHLRTVLAHELAHIARRDCLTQHIAHMACALHWFNPLVWVVERRMALERERACDDVAMNHATSAAGYATLLLDIARRACERALPRAAVLAMAQPSELETRLVAILDPVRDRTVMTRRARRVLTATAMLTVALTGVVRLDAAPVAPPMQVVQTRKDSVADTVERVVHPNPELPQRRRRVVPSVVQQGRVEPDTRNDSVAHPSSERIAAASVDLARRRGELALSGSDSALARMLLVSLEREPRSAEDLVKERAVWALSQARGDRLIEPLITALDDEDWRVRAYAAWALAPARDSRAVPALLRQMSHPVWRLRAMAAHALVATGDPRAREVMAAAASDEAWQVRANGVRYLAQFDDDDARARVRAALQDSHIAVRGAAERAP